MVNEVTKQNHIPLILYKYYTDNIFSYRSLALRGIYCHYPKNMNDPFECLGYIERTISQAQIKDFKNSLDINKKVSKILLSLSDEKIVEFINKQRQETIKKFTFSSLSESFDDISLWSHYASGHTGFAIELHFNKAEITNNFQKVQYVSELPEFDVIKMAQFLNGEDDRLDYLLSDISIKSKNWETEKEWRIWRKSPTYFHYTKYNIKNVYFGINCCLETKGIIAKLVGDINDKANYYQMGFGDNPIKLIIE